MANFDDAVARKFLKLFYYKVPRDVKTLRTDNKMIIILRNCFLFIQSERQYF